MPMKKLVKVMNKESTPFAFKISGDIIKTTEDVSVRELANILAEKKIGAVIVEKEGKLAGIVSERDIVWKVVAQGKSIEETKVKDIMTKDVVTIDLNQGVDVLYETMKKAPFRHLPIRRGDNIIGMVSSRDLMYLRKLKETEGKG
jgi:CBS domain-containing protein